MSEEKKYYVLCGTNCLYESMTKEQILAAITQAVNEGTVGDVDAGFITRIQEQNKNAAVKFWVGTMAEYNAIEEKETNCFYITTDDVSYADLCEELSRKIEAVQNDLLQKAPAGYGLGTPERKQWADVDTLTGTGWYSLFGIIEAGGATASNAYMFVSALAGGGLYATQHLYILRDLTTMRLVRERQSGVWGEWEWENPPMKENVEYRTTERWNGKAVYTKWESISVAANEPVILHAFTISAGTGNIKMLRHRATHADGSSLSNFCPEFGIGSYYEITELLVDGQLRYTRNEQFATDAQTLYAQIWYTKD